VQKVETVQFFGNGQVKSQLHLESEIGLVMIVLSIYVQQDEAREEADNMMLAHVKGINESSFGTEIIRPH
jgi:hypothetical protein